MDERLSKLEEDIQRLRALVDFLLHHQLGDASPEVLEKLRQLREEPMSRAASNDPF
jgi:hypothetical protein